MNLRIITKNHADDSKKGSPLKIDFKAEWTHESMPTAWVLIKKIFLAGLIFYFLVLGKLLFRRKISQLWQTLLGALFQISENIMIWITNNT